ncbi:MAG: hypothetical protein ACI8RD_006330 [Bacillariaceae sp.]|jgi:hypothetical protein
MAGKDTDTINERLNGLVNLLQVAGIDGVDSDALIDEQKRPSSTRSKGSRDKKSSSSSKKKASSDTAASSSDAQILEIIKKLQQAQADSPELLEALKNPQLMALASLAAQNQSTEQKQKQKPSLATSLDDVLDDDDNFPKIGPGYSDECSVISEMSTPTVMTRQNVAEEEHYREIKGMHIGSGGGGGQQISSPTPRRKSRMGRSAMGTVGGGGKTKNMLSQVRPMAATRRQTQIPIPTPKPVVSVGGGGAAAQRRLNYQMAMNKLQSTGFGKQTPSSETGNKNDSLLSPTKKQTEFVSVPSSPAKSDSKERKSSKSKSANSKSTTATSGTGSSNDSGSGSGGRRKISSNDNSNGTNIDWGMTDSNGWPEFDEGNTKNDNKDAFVDKDGFFSDDVFSSNDGFDAGRSPTSTTRRKENGRSSARERSPPRKSKSTSSGLKKPKPSRSDEKKSSRTVDDGTGTAGTTKRTHRAKKDKDNDHTSDNTRKSKEKEKSGNRTRKSSRQSSLAM